ncbi:hypothetical protein HYU14_05270 [Candidatus Woesearchaeota archaeon]|nr:hypothetical protein [Candidatus Woesearchaeota archaeon]
MADTKLILSYLIPLLSISILLGYAAFTSPTITGFAVQNVTEGLRELEANVVLETTADEVLPESTKVSVMLDKETAFMNLYDFIKRTGMPYTYSEGNISSIGYAGKGFTGNYTYILPLSEFNIFRMVKPGEHHLSVQLVYLNHVLFERSEDVAVS